MLEISAHDARHFAVAAQGMNGATSAIAILRAQGILQLDALTRVDRAHRLSCFARLPADTTGPMVDDSLWSSSSAVSFETYTHAACLLPIEDWPLFRPFRESARSMKGRPQQRQCDEVLKLVQGSAEGVTMSDIEGAGEKTAGWNWSNRKRAAEYMVWSGDLVSTTRHGFKRIYDLPERRLSEGVLATELDINSILVAKAHRALAALGIVTVSDLMWHYNISLNDASFGLDASDGVRVSVEGTPEASWLDPNISTHSCQAARFIGPFDNMLRDRSRARRVFGFDYIFEAYKPVRERKYGHYVMGVLDAGSFVGRVDVFRDKELLTVATIYPESGVLDQQVVDSVEVAGEHLSAQLGLCLRVLGPVKNG